MHWESVNNSAGTKPKLSNIFYRRSGTTAGDKATTSNNPMVQLHKVATTSNNPTIQQHKLAFSYGKNFDNQQQS